MSLVKILHVLAIVDWVERVVLAETFPCSFDAIVTDSRGTTDRHIRWVSLARKAMLTVEPDRTLSAGGSSKILLTNTNVFGNILVLALNPCSHCQIMECSLTITVKVTVIITQLI